jgi:hypothetical protein
MQDLFNEYIYKSKMFIRKCICGKEIIYKTKQAFRIANNKNCQCKSCASIKRMKNIEARKNISNKVSGANNPMYGKSIYERWIEMYGNVEADKRLKTWNDNLKCWGHGHINPNEKTKGKTYVQIHGEEKSNVIKHKLSIKSSGINNPMYGKPSPIGSGNGWSGWYNGWYFRSLHELSYMINVIERFNFKWESGECKKYKIEYINYNGIKKNYFADFIINKKYVIEIKPKKLWQSDTVKRKKESAMLWANKNNLKYKLTESPKQITLKEIEKLKSIGSLIFINRYERKFKERYACC